MKQDLKNAMKQKDKATAQVLKSLLSDFTYAEKNSLTSSNPTTTRITSVNMLSAVLHKAIKKRKDSFHAYQDCGREDLALIEQKEVDILSRYLPRQMSEAEASDMIQKLIQELGLSQPKELGKLMKVLNEKVDGSMAPRKMLSDVAKKLLNSP